jgi:hypothetical protein
MDLGRVLCTPQVPETFRSCVSSDNSRVNEQRQAQSSSVIRAKSLQAVEKDPPASFRSIASLQRIGKYASARRFSRAPRIWPFLNSLEAEFFNSLVTFDIG